jgi:hypothetical protein
MIGDLVAITVFEAAGCCRSFVLATHQAGCTPGLIIADRADIAVHCCRDFVRRFGDFSPRIGESGLPFL